VATADAYRCPFFRKAQAASLRGDQAVEDPHIPEGQDLPELPRDGLVGVPELTDLALVRRLGGRISLEQSYISIK
jgi:hypothetical protein